MFTTSSVQQLTLWGDNWIYKEILKKLSQNHPLLKLKEIVEKVIVKSESKIESYYTSDFGRPAYQISVIFKMILLEYLYNLSDVKISQICTYDLLFKWFIGLDVMDPVPDDTTLVKFRKRLKENGFREVFNALIKEAKRLGYLRSGLRIIDATHIFSYTPQLGFIRLLKQGINKTIQKIKKVDKKLGKYLEEKYKFALNKFEKQKAKAEKIKKAASDLIKEVKIKLKKKTKELKEFLKTFQKVLKSENSNKIINFNEPDARWGHKTKKFTFGGYRLQISCTKDLFVTNIKVMNMKVKN